MTKLDLIEELCKRYIVTITHVANVYTVSIESKRNENITRMSVPRDNLLEALLATYNILRSN